MYSKKSMGQHFINDRNLLRKIVEVAGPLDGYSVLEIGPGYGSLTQEILNAGPKNLIAIEKDLSFEYHKFDQQKSDFIFGDALKIDECSLLTRPAKIIANLPYNISSQLIFKWLEYMSFFSKITIMLQREFAMRLTAQSNCKEYGRITVLTQLMCDIKYEFSVHKQCFIPPPKVDSSVISLTPLPAPRFASSKKHLEDFTKFAFNHRRKQLGGILKNFLGDPKDILPSCGIDPMSRPENLTLQQYCILSLALKDINKL